MLNPQLKLVLLEKSIDGLFTETSLTFMRDELPQNTVILAQMVEDPDVLGQMQDAWNNFVETGQVWALLIGVFIGYMFRSLTSY
jgi:hypothetical protein